MQKTHSNNTIIYNDDDSIFFQTKIKKNIKKKRFTLLWDILDFFWYKNRKKTYTV